jgi:uncharacterized protein (TIGR03083 family)
MDPVAHLDALQRESAAMTEAARRGVSAAVPSCPGWTVADLVHHTGGVHRWVTQIVEQRPAEGDGFRDIRRAAPPPDEELADWFAAGADALQTTLRAADPADAAWTWTRRANDVAFWYRRMAQETAVHRWDAQAAHGDAQPVESELAADGADEFLEMFLPGLRNREADPPMAGERFHFHRTDGPGEWLVAFGEDGRIAVTREHAKGDVAVRGPASDLLLFVWGRTGEDQLEVFGDASLLDRWRALVLPA